MRQLNLLLLPSSTSIFEQLQLEEALLRTSKENWLLLNSGSSPAIVMGISAKEEEVINFENLEKNPIPLIRRYSGGGTVVVDADTLFISWIIQKKEELCHPFPKSIMEWSVQFLPFSLQENDYVLNNKKVGGNAQSIVREAFVHHTTLLWDFQPNLMALLKLPPKMPEYREKRSHLDFITTLNPYFLSKEVFFETFLAEVQKVFHVEEKANSLALNYLNVPHRKSTVLYSVKLTAQIN